jgi:photosystem II stability/assembly factor-like uncharacterized protein
MKRIARVLMSVACLALLIVPGCRDEDEEVAALVDPGPDPGPEPEPEPVPEPDFGPPPDLTPDPVWQLQLNPLPRIGAISAVDGDRVWISTSNYSFRRSSNGGATWTTLSYPGTAYSGHIRFAGETQGWLSTEGSIYVTSDGGDSWTMRYEEAPFGNPCVVNATTAWFSGYYGTCGRTIDGGETWTPVELPSGIAPKLKFFDAQNGLVSVMSPDSIRRIYAATNAGASWQAIFSTDSSISAYSAVNMDEIWVALQLDSGWPGHVRRTRNGGASWTTVEVPAQAIYDIQFLDSWRGWLTTDGNVYRTQDGGATWTAQQMPDIPGGPYTYFGFRQVEFVGDRTGWVTGSYGNTISGTQDFVMKATPPEE